jgi:hypothetical protein
MDVSSLMTASPFGVLGMCDSRAPSDTEPRFWQMNVRCTCNDAQCRCPKDKLHGYIAAMQLTRAEAHAYAQQGNLCLECGG